MPLTASFPTHARYSFHRLSGQDGTIGSLPPGLARGETTPIQGADGGGWTGSASPIPDADGDAIRFSPLSLGEVGKCGVT